MMNFFQFIYSAILLGIGVVLGWYLNNRSQLKTQKNQHEFELKKLEIERTEPYKEKLHNLRFEAYSHIWAECMVCWKEFVFKQWLFKDDNYKDLRNALNNFYFEVNKKSFILKESVLETLRNLLTTLDLVILDHLSILADKNNVEARKYMRESTTKSIQLIDKLEKEIRKDLQLPEIEKGLAETFYPKELNNKKEPKRQQPTKS